MFKRRKKRDITVEKMIADIQNHCKESVECLRRCSALCDCSCNGRKEKGDGNEPSPRIVKQA